MGKSSFMELIISEKKKKSDYLTPKCPFGFYGSFVFNICISLENISYRDRISHLGC